MILHFAIRVGRGQSWAALAMQDYKLPMSTTLSPPTPIYSSQPGCIACLITDCVRSHRALEPAERVQITSRTSIDSHEAFIFPT